MWLLNSTHLIQWSIPNPKLKKGVMVWKSNSGRSWSVVSFLVRCHLTRPDRCVCVDQVEMSRPGTTVRPSIESSKEKALLEVKYTIFKQCIDLQRKWRGLVSEALAWIERRGGKDCLEERKNPWWALSLSQDACFCNRCDVQVYWVDWNCLMGDEKLSIQKTAGECMRRLMAYNFMIIILIESWFHGSFSHHRWICFWYERMIKSMLKSGN